MKIRQILAGAAVLLALTGTAGVAYGASTVSSLSISVKGTTEEGVLSEPSISVSPSSCEISDISWSKEVDDWKPGKVVYGYLTITADGDREFAKSYSSSKCSVSGADFRSATAEEDEPSVLNVTIKYTPKVQLEMTEEAGWNDTNRTKASWKKVKYATAYELRLYQNDTWIKTLEVTGTSVDISPYINQQGDYYYEVRAKGKTEDERKYLLTGEYVASEDVLTMDAGEIGDVGGSWSNQAEGRKYRTSDGTYPSSQWQMVLGQWYYFDQNGYAVTGWHCDAESGNWYYMDSQGIMQTGWQNVGGVWYYLDTDGKMVTGWVQSKPGEWYYLNPDGSMAVNTVVDGQYTVDADGRYVAAP